MPANYKVGASDVNPLCNPVTSAACIQSAIDGLPSQGGVVYIGPGTYEIGSGVPLRIQKPNVALVGSGPSTVISLPATASATHSLLWVGRPATGVPLRNVTIEHIRFQGNQFLGANPDRMDQPGSSGIVLHAAVSDPLWNNNPAYDEIEQVTIKNCFFEGFARYGVFGNNARGDANGWPYDKKLRYVRVVGNIFRDCYTGAYFSGAQLCSFIGNVGARMWSADAGGATVYLWGSEKCIVNGNVGDGGNYGFIGERTHGMNYSGNCVFGTDRYGLGVEQGQYFNVAVPAANNVRGNVVGNSGGVTLQVPLPPEKDMTEDLLEEISIRGFKSSNPSQFPTKPETYTLVSGNNVRNNTASPRQRAAIGELNYQPGGTAGSAPNYNLIIRNKITEANDEYGYESTKGIKLAASSLALKNYKHDET